MYFQPTTCSRLIVFWAAVLALGACTSAGSGRRGGPPGGPGGGRSAQMGEGPASPDGLNGPLARPVSLLFAGMDSDQDMQVSRAELEMASAEMWNSLSPDQPTVTPLTLSGWLATALGSPDAQPSPVAFDTNFDGTISQREFDIRLRALFESLDASSDGKLDRSELVFDASRTGHRSGGRSRMRILPES